MNISLTPDDLNGAAAKMLSDPLLAGFAHEAAGLLYRAHMAGVVIRVESVPNYPLAMGNYHDGLDVRHARVKA